MSGTSPVGIKTIPLLQNLQYNVTGTQFNTLYANGTGKRFLIRSLSEATGTNVVQAIGQFYNDTATAVSFTEQLTWAMGVGNITTPVLSAGGGVTLNVGGNIYVETDSLSITQNLVAGDIAAGGTLAFTSGTIADIVDGSLTTFAEMSNNATGTLSLTITKAFAEGDQLLVAYFMNALGFNNVANNPSLMIQIIANGTVLPRCEQRLHNTGPAGPLSVQTTTPNFMTATLPTCTSCQILFTVNASIEGGGNRVLRVYSVNYIPQGQRNTIIGF